jgi:hypothetical protein
VPIAGDPRFAQAGQQFREAVVEGELVDVLAVLQTEADAAILRVGQKLFEPAADVRPIRIHPLAESRHGLGEQLLVLGRLGRERLSPLAEVAAVFAHGTEPEKLDSAEVQHHRARADLAGEVEGALGMPQPQGSLARIGAGGHVEVRGRLAVASRQRAEVVQGGDPHHPVLERLDNARHERDADTVAQLHPLEPEVRHLAQHRVAVGMTLR